MAIIQIPIGGRPVTVDVPDFAMESTQQDVKNAIQDLVTTMGGVVSKIDDTSSGDMAIKGAVDDLTSYQRSWNETKSRVRDSKLAQNVGRSSALGMTQALAKPGMTTNLMKSLGLGAMATSLGMVTGLGKELAATFSFAGSVGLNFGQDTLKTAENLSDVGLQLDQFGNIIAQNLPVFRELGANVDDGSNVFVDVLKDFRGATKDFGYFGMASDEMGQFLAEELEVRRKSMDAEQLRLYVQEDLTQAMKDNFIEQEKMARITGQNVRERVRAQMAAKSDVIMQASMAGMTDEQRKQVDAVMGNFTKELGPIGQELQKAVIQELAMPGGGFINTRLGEIIAKDQSGKLADIFEMSVAAIQGGGSNVEASSNNIAQAIQDFRGSGQNNFFAQLAITGDQTMKDLLTMSTNIVEVEKEIHEKRAELMTAENQARMEHVYAMRAMTAELDVQQAKEANVAMRTILGIAGGEDNLVKGLRDFTESASKILSDPLTKGFFSGFGELVGSVTVQPFMKMMSGNADEFEKLFILGMFGQASGVLPDQVANALMFGQRAEALVQGSNKFFETAFKDYMEEVEVPIDPRDPDGPKKTVKKFNYDKFIADKGNMFINGSAQYFTSMTDAFVNALQQAGNIIKTS